MGLRVCLRVFRIKVDIDLGIRFRICLGLGLKCIQMYSVDFNKQRCLQSPQVYSMSTDVLTEYRCLLAEYMCPH